MALPDFHPSNELHASFIIEGTSSVCNHRETASSTRNPIAETVDQSLPESNGTPVFSAVQSLALNMEQARQQLQALLLENFQAVKLLTAYMDSVTDDSTDLPEAFTTECIVQNNDFVQPSVDHQRSEFLPSVLLSVADRIGQQFELEPLYRVRLIDSRNQLNRIRQQMISANTGLVALIAYKHKTTSLSFDDLIQEGIVGLIKAVDRFDPHRNIRFSTYAVFWIKQAISRLIVKQEKVVRLPIALAEKASLVFDVMRSCYLESGRWPSLAELETQCGLPIEDIKIISSYYQATHSLDASLSEESDDLTLISTLKQQQFSLPLNELIATNLSLYLSKVVASLPEKEAAILNMRFGLKNQTEMTLQAVADQLHVTRERVRQIQNQALKKLKQQFGYELLPFLEPNDS